MHQTHGLLLPLIKVCEYWLVILLHLSVGIRYSTTYTNHGRRPSPRRCHQQVHLGEDIATGAAHTQPAGLFPVMPAAVHAKAMLPIRRSSPECFR
jgi:hypothetical protein